MLTFKWIIWSKSMCQVILVIIVIPLKCYWAAMFSRSSLCTCSPFSPETGSYWTFYIVSKIEWVIWIRYGHRLTTFLLLLWILVIYQVLSVSFLCNNIPDTLFLSPPRNFWKCTGSSHIMVSVECVQWDKFKVSLKTGFLWVFWQ